jgi:hypothetical protein
VIELGGFERRLSPGMDAALRSVKSEKPTTTDNENQKTSPRQCSGS